MRLFVRDRGFYRKALSLALPMILQSFISIGVTADTAPRAILRLPRYRGERI